MAFSYLSYKDIIRLLKNAFYRDYSVMKAEVKWIEDLKFVGKTDKNQEIIFGSGDSTIVSPMEIGG